VHRLFPSRQPAIPWPHSLYRIRYHSGIGNPTQQLTPTLLHPPPSLHPRPHPHSSEPRNGLHRTQKPGHRLGDSSLHPAIPISLGRHIAFRALAHLNRRPYASPPQHLPCLIIIRSILRCVPYCTQNQQTRSDQHRRNAPYSERGTPDTGAVHGVRG
jgi:hypothetical protein